jgi:hypothetical protein
LKYQPAKKIIFVFLVLTLVSSVSTITFVTGNNNMDIAFAKKHNSSGSNGGGDKSSTDNTNIGTTTTGGNDDHNRGGSSSDSGSGSNNGGSATSPLSTENSGNSPTATIDNTHVSSQTCPDGSAPSSDGSCPSTTLSPPLSPVVNCNTTPNDPTCPASTTTTTTPSSLAQQNLNPQTLIQPRCPLIPTDANGNCQGVDMQGVGSGLPPRLGSPQGQQGHYNIPDSVMVKPQLPDGACPADYHYNSSGNYTHFCTADIHLKYPDGSCPEGTMMTQYNTCIKIPVLPGSYTDPKPGGGFIQMYPTRSNTPPATSPTNTSPYLPPPSTK